MTVADAARLRCKSISPAFATFILVGCVERPTPPLQFSPYFVTERLSEQSTAAWPVSFGRPSQVLIRSGVVFVAADSGSKSAVIAFPINAPGEALRWPIPEQDSAVLRSVWSLQPDPEGRGVWAYDLTKRTLHRLAIRSRGEGMKLERMATVRLDSGGTYTGPVWTSVGGELMSPGFFVGGRIAVFTAQGRRTGAYGTVPTPSQPATELVASRAAQARVAVRPNGRQVAMAWFYSDRLEIVEIASGRIHDAFRPIGFDSPFEAVNGRVGPVYTPKLASRICYVSIDVTDDYIFALFSGRGGDEKSEGTASAGREVHVYDWSGELKQVIVLRRDAHSISISENGSAMATVLSAAGEQVHMYELQSIIK